jgi:hypothetical protein
MEREMPKTAGMWNVKRTRTVLIAAFLVVASVLLGWRLLDPIEEFSVDDQRQAEGVVAAALIAVKREDTKTVMQLLHSKSLDFHGFAKYPSSVPGVIARTRSLHWLDELTESEIRRSVKSLPSMRRKLLGSMLDFSLDQRYVPADQRFARHSPRWDQETPVAVRYTLNGVPMLSIALRQNGRWKLSEVPPSWSANVLNYGCVSDAGRHDDALAEDVMLRRDRDKP